MSSSIVPANQQLPAFLQGLQTSKTSLLEDFGGLTKSDVSLTFVKICQSTSPEGKSKDPKVAPKVNPGLLFDSKNKDVIAAGTPFMPLFRKRKFIHWTGPINEGGKIAFSTDNPNDPRIRAIKGLEFLTDPATGKTLPPAVTEYLNFYLMVAGYDDPLVLSFSRTSTKEGKDFSQSLLAQVSKDQLPMYAHQYVFGDCVFHEEGDLSWWKISIKPDGVVQDEEAFKMAEEMYNKAKVLADLVSDAAYDDKASENLDAVETIQDSGETVLGDVKPTVDAPKNFNYRLPGGKTMTVDASGAKPTQVHSGATIEGTAEQHQVTQEAPAQQMAPVQQTPVQTQPVTQTAPVQASPTQATPAAQPKRQLWKKSTPAA